MNSKRLRFPVSCFLIAMVLFSYCSNQVNICYVSCKWQSCLQTDSLACTDCDPGFVLINQRCVAIGGQSVNVLLFRNL